MVIDAVTIDLRRTGGRPRGFLSKQHRQQSADCDHSAHKQYGIEEGSKLSHGPYL